MECTLVDNDGTKAVVMCGHEKKTFKSSEIGQVNPPKFEKCEDMANLTFLNDASVFWNLKVRFTAKLIYTYSGLFCIVVNPYKRYPIYTGTVVKMYLGKRRNEVPPHLWAITETAYRNMLTNTKDQAMLITGESGAGKTENTKKVISYLAAVAAPKKASATKKVSLEDQIVATNPILESYGNAKTSRNDNSSRFGKFIRIHFTQSGKLCGCDIESYLLEKSRITQQQEVERSYHIFYQLLQPHVPNMKADCMLGDDIYDYSYVSQGKVTVASIDDNEELEYTDQAFDIIGFSNQEKWDCYKITAAVMSFGEVKFVQKGRDDQAEPGDLAYPTKIATLFGVDVHELLKGFCKPKIKVGAEWVTKGQTCEQATNGVGGIARACFDRLFKWLIIKCNDTLIDATMKKANFCAVLDIAGFEIFEYNGFEQISINFVNEKLQQFFNHHMFVVEQEEYVAEGIDWAMVDFGMDLAACIIMFEKPMGVWAILEEETLFPKSSDKTFEDKLKSQLLGKAPPFAKPQSKTDKNAHFAIIHYAGTVSYNVTGWLEKNKDPVNDTVVDVLKQGSNALLVHLWREHPGQSNPPEEDKGAKKKRKGSGPKTVTSVYLVQLAELMGTLHSTEPHFIRCLVPNTHKQPGAVETELIMHQLTCNGVLEGIRICMRGFPNRMLYPDFKSRYAILGAAEINSSSDNKVAAYALLDKIEFSRERYRLGHTKVFFRAGALAGLEEARDDIVLKLVRYMQGQCYGYIQRKVFQVKFDQRELMKVCQRNFRKFMSMRNWGWFIIIQKTRPLIGQQNPEEELRLLEEKCNSAFGAYQDQLETKKRLEQENVEMVEENKTLMKQLEAEQGNMSQYTERQAKASAQKADFEVQLSNAGVKLTQMEQARQQAMVDKKNLEGDNVGIKKDIEDLELVIQKLEQEKTNRDHTIRSLNDEIANQDEVLNKLNKEKKHQNDNWSKACEDLQASQEKVDHLNKIKNKLESTLGELDNSLGSEKRGKGDIEKQRRKIEGDLRVTQESVSELERIKKELETSIARKEKDLAQLSSKLDDEQSIVSKVQKSIKETQGRVEEMEEELEAERQARAKAERQRSDLARELERVGERLNEAGGATAAQMELNKKRDSEIFKLRKDLEEAKIQQDATLMSLKKKHQDAVAEMSEQIDQLSKMKAKIEKDRNNVNHETVDVRAATEEIGRSKASAEKSNKTLISSLNDLNRKVEEANLTLGDMESSKRKIAAENADLLRQLQEHENHANMLTKTKIQLQAALDEAKKVADDEARDRVALHGKFKNLEHELEGTRDHMEEETGAKDDTLRQVAKAMQESDFWRCKYETECLAKSEDLEMAKCKLQARLSEAQGTIEQLHNKLAQVEKAKVKIQGEIDEMATMADQAQVLNGSMEKKAKQFDRVVSEWKHKVDSLGMDLDVSQKECRNVSSELFRVKSAYEESVLQLDEVRKENKCLSNEIKDIMDQISEGGRSIHEIDKIRKRLEAEKMELQAALEEAEGSLEQEENKVLRAQLELTQVKQEIERRIAEKEEEFQSTKKNYHQQIRESQAKLEDEQRTKESVRDAFLANERRANAAQNALEEARTLLEQADRARRMTEQELSDTNEQLSELTCQNQAIAGAKRKLESEMQTLHGDLDEMANEALLSEEKAKKAMVDAAKLADELRTEQELAQVFERDRKLYECQVKDMQTRLDEAESNALKGGKKAMNKMETRIRELESEVDAESRRSGDAQKNLRKSERRIKELTYASDEDRKNHERMQALVDQLQAKIKSYKKQT